MKALETLKVDETLKGRLSAKLAGQGERIRFSDDPALASLCTCLGLEFEIGRPDFDRLSPFFGADVAQTGENPWAKRILIQDHKIGIELRRVDGKPLMLWHEDFRFIIDPAAADFHLRDGSAFVDQGAVAPLVVDDFCGTARNDGANDVGALEYAPDATCATDVGGGVLRDTLFADGFD